MKLVERTTTGWKSSRKIFINTEERIDKDVYTPVWIDVGSIESFREGAFGFMEVFMVSGRSIQTNCDRTDWWKKLREIEQQVV